MSQFLALLGQLVDQNCSGTSGTSPKVGRSLNKNYRMSRVAWAQGTGCPHVTKLQGKVQWISHYKRIMATLSSAFPVLDTCLLKAKQVGPVEEFLGPSEWQEPEPENCSSCSFVWLQSKMDLPCPHTFCPPFGVLCLVDVGSHKKNRSSQKLPKWHALGPLCGTGAVEVNDINDGCSFMV